MKNIHEKQVDNFSYLKHDYDTVKCFNNIIINKSSLRIISYMISDQLSISYTLHIISWQFFSKYHIDMLIFIVYKLGNYLSISQINIVKKYFSNQDTHKKHNVLGYCCTLFNIFQIIFFESFTLYFQLFGRSFPVKYNFKPDLDRYKWLVVERSFLLIVICIEAKLKF